MKVLALPFGGGCNKCLRTCTLVAILGKVNRSMRLVCQGRGCEPLSLQVGCFVGA